MAKVDIWYKTPQVNNQSKYNANVAAEPSKRNMFYALKGREEKEKSSNVVMDTLHVFTFPVYALL